MSRTRMVRLITAMLFALGLPGVAGAEVSEVKIATQYGIGYLPLTIMKHDKLIEKSLARVGLGDTKVSWVKLGAGAAANDALLSGSLDFASGGTGPAFILWDRTRGSIDVRGGPERAAGVVDTPAPRGYIRSAAGRVSIVPRCSLARTPRLP